MGQEVLKRLDARRGYPAYGPESSAEGVGHRHRPAGPQHRHELSKLFSQGFTSSTPAPSHRDAVITEADAILAGRFNLFGRGIPLDAETIQWTTHPFSGASAPAAPWFRVVYMEGIGGGDVKELWELNRHAFLVRLAQAYALTGDTNYVERALALLRSWLKQDVPGLGINWASALEVGFRAVSWCWLWDLTRGSGLWDDATVRHLRWSLAAHGRHLFRYHSIHHSPNTHLTGEAISLVYLGECFPELLDSEKWGRWGRRMLVAEGAEQILQDGMHFERSVGYHRYTLEFYVHWAALERARGSPLPPNLHLALSKLMNASLAFVRPDGTMPIVGDEDSGAMVALTIGDPHSHLELICAAADLLGQAAPVPARLVRRDLSYWLGLEHAPYPPQEERAGPRAVSLTHAGYFSVSESWQEDAWHCVVDAGVHGGELTGHAHTDLGHVEISRGREHVIVDPGCSSYTIDRAARDWCRSERAHACLVTAGRPLAVPRGAFSWVTRSPVPVVSVQEGREGWAIRLAYDMSRDGAAPTRHTRVVTLIPGVGILVGDWIEGPNVGASYLNWPLAHPVPVLNGTGLSLGDLRMTWCIQGGSQPPAELHAITTSPGYQRRTAAHALHVPLPTPIPSAVATLFHQGTSAPVHMTAQDDRMEVDVPWAGLRVTLALRGDWVARVASGANL